MKNARRGVTLIELLIVIAIVATLTAILIPVLRQLVVVRKDMQDLSNLRQTMIDYFGFAAEHRDRVVNAGLPNDEETRWFYGRSWGAPLAGSLYLSQQSVWTRVLSHWLGPPGAHWHSSYEDFLIEHPYLGTVHASEFGEDRLSEFPSRYKLSLTMLSTHDAWTYPGRGMTNREFIDTSLKVVQFSEIARPSQKGVLIHLENPRAEQGQHHVAFADGSVSMRDMEAASPTAGHPLSRHPDIRGRPVTATLNGYLGVDYLD